MDTFKKRLHFVLTMILFCNISAQTITLEQFIEQVKKHNHDLLLINKEVESAEKQIDQAWTSYLPQIFGSARGEYFLKKPSPGNNERNFLGSVQLDQSILNISNIKSIRSANLFAKSVEHASVNNINQLIESAKKNFYLTLLLQNILRVENENSIIARRQYDFVLSRFQNGQVSEFELKQAEISWKNTIPILQEAERQLNEAHENMRFFTANTLPSTFSLESNEIDFPALPLAKNVTDIVDLHPGYKALKTETEFATSEVSRAIAGFYPSLNAMANYSYLHDKDRFQNLNTSQFTVGLNLQLPLFEGGSKIVKIQEQQIELDKSRIKLAQFKQELELKLNTLYENLEVAYKNIGTSEENESLAEKGYQLAEESYKNDLITRLELQEARLALSKSRIETQRYKHEYITNLIEWERLTSQELLNK